MTLSDTDTRAGQRTCLAARSIASSVSRHTQRVEDTALAWPKVLLTKDGVDHRKWAVIACEQYTSEIEYWNDVENIVGDATPTFCLIFPWWIWKAARTTRS